MASAELSLFSYEILGLVGRQGAGAHDLLQMAKRGRMLAWAGESQYYTEPKRLAELGYLAARKEPGKTRERTIYALTDKGLQALAEWARTPCSITPLKSEPLLRLLICDLVGEDVTRESMTGLREDISAIQARLDDAERSASELPHRERNLRLVIGFLRDYLDLHTRLINTIEREMAPSSAAGSTGTAPPRRGSARDAHHG